MPIVPPDIHRGATRLLSAPIDNDLLLRTLAYCHMCNASLASVVRVALSQLLAADKAELDAYVGAHPDELDHRKLRGFATATDHGGVKHRKKKDKEPQAR
jgi:hypothetical protein